MKTMSLSLIWTVFWLCMESTLLAGFPADTVRCDFVFLSVVTIGFMMERREGFPYVFLMGLLTDGVSPAPFGIFTFAYLFVFEAIRFVNAIIYFHSYVARFVWIVGASMIFLWLTNGIMALVYKNTAFMSLTLIRFVPQAIWNGLVGLAVIPFFDRYLNLSWEKLTRPKGLVLK